MNKFYSCLVVFFSAFVLIQIASAQTSFSPQKYNNNNACADCKIKTGSTKFFDDGGKFGNITNKYSVTTLQAEPGYVLSLYFLEIDLPKGGRINVYSGNEVKKEKLVKTFYQIEKTSNIIGNELTVEYIPSSNSINYINKGWVAHLDRLIPIETGIDQDVQSPPESDCPYAIPLCQNNTAIALGGQYTDLGQINDDAGSCYSGTGSGGSVWYSFSPQSSGPVDFTINPQGSTDYDFVLWDITNGCQDNKRTQLACNFSLYTGITGLNSTLCNENNGSCSSNDCTNQSKGSDCNRFNNRVNVTAGRQYAICINFYSGSNDGFLLEFKKQASSVPITDNTLPVVTNAFSGNCPNASNFKLNFSEWVSCASIQNTDFTLAGRTFTIVNTNCINGRSLGVDISVSPPLTSGSYSILAQNITDLCGNNMNSSFNVTIGAPPIGSISTPVLVCKSPGLFGGFNYSPGSQTITASGGTSYIWSDGQTGASAVFSATSTKTVSVTIINGGCSSTASTTINVESVSINLGPDKLYCGTPLVLTASPAVAGSTYTFYRSPVLFPPSNGTQIQTGINNTVSVSPGGYTTYRVVVTSPNGCKASDDINVSVNPPANASITVPGSNFCLGANPFVLTASPPGGTFTGRGISNDTFYPSRAGVGVDTVRYTVTNGCGTFTGQVNIRVSAGALPTVNLNPTYCVNDANVTLNPNPTCGTFSGPGITQAGACVFGFWIAQPVFSPSTAGIGNHAITYSGAGCANTFRVQVLGAGAAPVISGAAGPYCISSSAITLSASPAGGTFSGPGISGSTFTPATAGIGTHTVTYTVFSCGNSLTNTVQIQVVASSGSATIAYSPNTFCNALSTPQNVTRTGTAGGTYTATPAGLSINSSTGAIIPNTSANNTYTVTYTIPAAGGCPQFTTTATVIITSGITPTFTAIGPLCQNSTAPALPASSTNATPINGTWLPAAINTGTPGTTVYTFTPAAGQCATTATMSVTISNQITPTFTAIGPLCQNSAAPALPASSTNATPINGTWLPATINTNTPGTTVYTFTPAAGQCATTATLSVTISNQITPTFTAIGPLCQNSTAPALPASSTNATPINGTWLPATITTSTPGTTVYTFTPTAGQCATTATLSVTINNQITPTFTAIGPLCQNSTAPALPGSSTNATPINGTWLPATINTSTPGTTVYTFTPTAGQCATTATLSVTISNQITPTFTAIGPLCQNATAPALPASSTNATPINGTWLPATITTSTPGTTVYTFTPAAGQCATTATLSVTISNQITPTFNAIGPLCQNSTAPALPGSSTNATPINGTWLPATITTSTPGTMVYTFTPTAGQCATTATMSVTISNQITPTFTAIGPLCQNSTAPALPGSSTNATPINGTWLPATITTSTPGTTVYTFTPTAGQCATTATLSVTISNQITPTFTAIGPLCQNSTAPALPASSTNATPINGTWLPATINTSASGTTVYTFTPTAGQCATTATLSVTITSGITPTFNVIGPLCQNSTAPALPASSTNATPISGTWLPAAINTSTPGTTVYTFTPTAGQCATTATLSVTISNQITPTFTTIGPLCQNSTAPALPGSSTNATPINGTWLPATINTNTPGTTVYTFTPAAGQCATTTTLSVTINNQITPTFTAIGPLCQNSTAPALPASSTNATPINGTWLPATITTSTPGTTVYTFTPTAGQCATTATLSVTINNQITPTFTAIGPLCQNSTAPALPGSSTNATPINGTWLPATINTSTPGTTVYTFTPTAGQCATTATLSVTISNQITPTFAAIGPLCQNSTAPALPGSSTNATPINGTWLPATINTGTPGTTVYTFTPAAGQCATTATMSVTISNQITPTFTAIGPLCQNSTAPALPASSTNTTPINGTWLPATITTSTPGTTVYAFTPAAGQCATTATMSITISNQITPTFTAIGPLCQNSTAPALPASSTNATPINGTWLPATINTGTPGTTVYTFTPAAGQCATTATLSVTINNQITPTFTAIGPLCQNSTAPALPASSTNATPINGTWLPVTINTGTPGTTVYTFTPAAGQCATTATLSVTINNQITPTFNTYGPFCQDAILAQVILPQISNNRITGTWNPAMLSTSTPGINNYTFTPTPGQCASPTSLSVTINPLITPTFTAIPALCQNSTAPALPASSTNATPINGTWLPAAINTGTPGTTVYTFTPTAGQCAPTATMSVKVNPVKSTNITNTICQGQSVTIGNQTFNTSGNFRVLLQTSNGCDSSVNLTLTVNPVIVPSVSIQSDKNNICPGEAILFTATYTPAGLSPAFQWQVNGVNKGSNSSQFSSTILSNGDVITVQLNTTANCVNPTSVSSNPITAIVNSVNYSKPPVEYCKNDSSLVDLQILSSPISTYSIKWINGNVITTNSDLSTYQVNNTASGNIPFEITFGNNCIVRDALPVRVNQLPVLDATVNKSSVKYEEEVQLDVLSNLILTFNWTPAAIVSNTDIRNPTALIRQSTWFTVKAKDAKNCTNTDSVFVELIDECQDNFIYLPTAFSPNRDGVNDCFGILTPPKLSEFKLLIFNRWGEKVFEASDENSCWDGMYKGTRAESDSYVYLVSFKCYNGKLLSRKGALTIVK